MTTTVSTRDARPDEHPVVGRIMVDVYSRLEDFPSLEEQPDYYAMLANVGVLVERPATRILVAVDADDEVMGGVVYFGDMKQYGSGGTATEVRNAAGMRLLAVKPEARGKGAGRALTKACIRLAEAEHRAQFVLHTTRAMQVAWRMYEGLGFERSEDLDFDQRGLPVFGFRLDLRAR